MYTGLIYVYFYNNFICKRVKKVSSSDSFLSVNEQNTSFD